MFVKEKPDFYIRLFCCLKNVKIKLMNVNSITFFDFRMRESLFLVTIVEETSCKIKKLLFLVKMLS